MHFLYNRMKGKEMNNYTKNNTIYQTLEYIQPQTAPKKGFHPFYIFPILYVVSVYMMPFWAQFEAEQLSFFTYLIFLPLLFGVSNIIVSVKFCKPENRRILLNACVLVKYSLIPFFLVGGCIVLFFLFLSLIPVPFMIFVGPSLALMCSMIGWLILAFEAPYTISYLCASAKENTRPKATVVVHSILQFFFTVDVIDVMVLTLRERRWVKLTVGVILLLVIAVIALVALIGSGIAHEL